MTGVVWQREPIHLKVNKGDREDPKHELCIASNLLLVGKNPTQPHSDFPPPPDNISRF